MADFGDESGDVIARAISRAAKRLLDDFFKQLSHHEKSVPNDGLQSFPMPDQQTAEMFREYAEQQGLDTYLSTGANGMPYVTFHVDGMKDLNAVSLCYGSFAAEHPQMWEKMEQTLEQEMQSKDLLKDEIAEKVALAREEAKDFDDFKTRCAELGVDVTEAADGELKYTLQNERDNWFEVRGDTLGKKYTRASFGEKVPEKEKSKDEYDLDSEIKDMTEAKEQKEAERGGAREYDREMPSYPDRGER